MSKPLTYSTRNVLKVWRNASSTQQANGLAWYRDAHNIAGALAQRHGVTLEAVAGMLAATSPRCGWGQNVNIVARALDTGATTGCMGDAARKADKIMAGAAPLDVLGGSKVRAFFTLIASAGTENAVCVDRHAHDVAAGQVTDDAARAMLGTAKGYARVAECYRRAAVLASREAGAPVTPAQVQATTWVAWRDTLRVPGVHDRHVVTL